jgi:hypothetical protein
MRNAPQPLPPGFDPDDSPFETPPVEGIPFEKGSEEDLAIRRILDEEDAERRASEKGHKAP